MDNLIIKEVNKDYGDLHVLRNVNFTLPENSFVYLTGKTGSGKTTLLNLIRGELKPDQGSIQVNHWYLKKVKAKKMPYFRRSIGYVFQNSALVQDFTVEENLRYPLEAIGLDNKNIEKRYQDVLKLVDLYDLRKHKAKSLSGGQKQLTALARSIINLPYILLADEPTGNLDPTTAKNIMQILEKLPDIGISVIMATHDYNIIKQYLHPIYKIENHALVKKEVFELANI